MTNYPSKTTRINIYEKLSKHRDTGNYNGHKNENIDMPGRFVSSES